MGVCANGCYDQGTCNTATGICDCNGDRVGIDCTQSVCEDDCNGRGVCLGSGVCQCTCCIGGILTLFCGVFIGLMVAEMRRKKRKQEALRMLESSQISHGLTFLCSV